MSKAVQYFDGISWQRFGLTTEDITLSDSSGAQTQVANRFQTIKDADDNLFVYCIWNNETVYGYFAKIIKIDKFGTKTIGILDWLYSGCTTRYGDMIVSRDMNRLYFTTRTQFGGNTLLHIPLDFTAGNLSTQITKALLPLGSSCDKFSIYQDRYIWVVSGTTVYIYDYDSKVELASNSISTPDAIVCDNNNILYYIAEGGTKRIWKAVFNGTTVITVTPITGYEIANAKQMIIDRYGDLIILTNSGTTSTILKYTTTGTQIGSTLTLPLPSYNLNTDYQGNYYYSTYLATYKIPPNSAQGQSLAPVEQHQLFRGTGMTTYGNNMTGWNPGVNA